MELKLVKAKAGCMGCYYEDKEECPGDTAHFEKCVVNGEHMIFVPITDKIEGDNDGARV